MPLVSDDGVLPLCDLRLYLKGQGDPVVTRPFAGFHDILSASWENGVPSFLASGLPALELLPVHQFFHDRHLVELGLRNYWGYNSIGYFAPHGDYAARPGRQVDEFKTMVKELHAAGIGTSVHYPAIHLFAVYRRLGWKDGDFPIAERIGRNILSLPLFPAMTRADVARVARELTAVLIHHRKS